MSIAGKLVNGHFDENHKWVEGYQYTEIDDIFINSKNEGVTLNDIDISLAELKECIKQSKEYQDDVEFVDECVSSMDTNS